MATLLTLDELYHSMVTDDSESSREKEDLSEYTETTQSNFLSDTKTEAQDDGPSSDNSNKLSDQKKTDPKLSSTSSEPAADPKSIDALAESSETR